MQIVAEYSFNNEKTVIEEDYSTLYREVVKAIETADASGCKNKQSKEKTMPGRMLYSPSDLNNAIKKPLDGMGWKSHREKCDYSMEYYLNNYTPRETKGAFREMDFVKDKLGVEVQFGKYAFMVYNVCAKMTIFHNFGIIDAGIEIVPVKEFAAEMSTGVSYFEQFTWDLSKRGVSDIDIPVLILGIHA